MVISVKLLQDYLEHLKILLHEIGVARKSRSREKLDTLTLKVRIFHFVSLYFGLLPLKVRNVHGHHFTTAKVCILSGANI